MSTSFKLPTSNCRQAFCYKFIVTKPELSYCSWHHCYISSCFFPDPIKLPGATEDCQSVFTGWLGQENKILIWTLNKVLPVGVTVSSRFTENKHSNQQLFKGLRLIVSVHRSVQTPNCSPIPYIKLIGSDFTQAVCVCWWLKSNTELTNVTFFL